MQKTLIPFLALIIVPLFLFSQKKDIPELKVKFGKISEQEIKMKNYDKEPDAPAVILFDKASLSYDYSEEFFFIGTFERHVRLKIFKKEAYDLANFRVLFKASGYASQRIVDLKAFSYNVENDKLIETKLTDENIATESLTKMTSVKKITIPGVREGTIVELKYKITTNGVSSIPDWDFQERVPVIWSEYETEVPEFFDFIPISQGNTPFVVSEKSVNSQSKTISFSSGGDGMIGTRSMGSGKANWKTIKNHWLQKDIPSFITEKYMTSARDYVSRITFQLKGIYEATMRQSLGNSTSNSPSIDLIPGTYRPIYNSWEKLGEELYDEDNFGGAIDKKSATKETVSKLVSGLSSNKEKVLAIYNHIGKNFTKNERESLLMSQSVNDLMKNHKGTASDLNLLFINMLRTAEIQAAPILISTRGNGRINRFYPFLDRLDKTIVYIELSENEKMVADVSGYPQTINLLPFEDLNGEGFMIKDKKTMQWVPIKGSSTNRQFRAANFTLNTEGVAEGEVNYTFTGYSALDSRDKLNEISEDKFINIIAKTLISEGKLLSFKIENQDRSSDQSLKANIKLTTTSCTNSSGDKIYINPLTCLSEKENPFKADERLYDVDFGEPRDEFFQVNITIPDGYKIEEMPKSARHVLGDAAIKFEYLIAVKENTITINTKLAIKKTIFEPEVYKDLKEFYAKMLAKIGEQIVLTKGTNDPVNKK